MGAKREVEEEFEKRIPYIEFFELLNRLLSVRIDV